jgi:hypothetical protein
MKKQAKKRETGTTVGQKAQATPPIVTTRRARAEEVAAMAMPPEIALREAEEETDRKFLRGYVDSIHVLRQKGFSYREIAEWLNERSVAVDHNAVYRVYARFLLDDQSAAEEESRLQEEEREEA